MTDSERVQEGDRNGQHPLEDRLDRLAFELNLELAPNGLAWRPQPCRYTVDELQPEPLRPRQ